MTTAVYVRNTRKGWTRVDIKTSIIGRMDPPRFLPLSRRITDREYLGLFKLRATLVLM